MKIVKEDLNEEFKVPSEKVHKEFTKTLTFLRNKVFPKLDSDELLDFTEMLKDWIIKHTL